MQNVVRDYSRRKEIPETFTYKDGRTATRTIPFRHNGSSECGGTHIGAGRLLYARRSS